MASTDQDRAEVLIIGAGVIGASTALAMSKAGHDVLVIDRDAGAGNGSTGSSAGIIRVHASDSQSAAFAQDCLAAWNDWRGFLDADDDEELARFVQCGSLVLDAGNGFAEQAAEAMRGADVSFDEWNLQEMSDRFPYMDFHKFGPPKLIEDETFWAEPTEYLGGALYTPQSGYVGDPTLAAANLLRSAQRAGARVRLSATVATIDLDGDRVIGVTLDDGTSLRSDTVLLIAGPNTDALLSSIGGTSDFTIRTRRLREELLHVETPPGFDLALQGVHFVDGDLNINYRPEGAHAFVGGSNGDLTDEQTTIEDADQFDRLSTAAAWERGTLRLARRIPGLGIPRNRRGVVGLYDAAEDWLPIYDRTRFDGLFVGMATSGTQFKMAPIMGELLRHIVETEMGGRDHTMVPFESPFSDRTYSTAQFSRQRLPREDHARG